MEDDYIFYNDSLNTLYNYLNDEYSKYNLFNIPTPEKTLYCVNDKYFNSRRELKSYCNYKFIPEENTYTMDYFRILANQSDVIRKTCYDKPPIYLSVVDENGYGVYNKEKSFNELNYVWDYKYGNLRQEYKAFKDHGITFENDLYQEVDDKLEENLSKTRVLKKVG